MKWLDKLFWFSCSEIEEDFFISLIIAELQGFELFGSESLRSDWIFWISSINRHSDVRTFPFDRVEYYTGHYLLVWILIGRDTFEESSRSGGFIFLYRVGIERVWFYVIRFGVTIEPSESWIGWSLWLVWLSGFRVDRLRYESVSLSFFVFNMIRDRGAKRESIWIIFDCYRIEEGEKSFHMMKVWEIKKLKIVCFAGDNLSFKINIVVGFGGRADPE